MGWYFMLLFVSAIVTGLVLRALRIPFDLLHHKWQPLWWIAVIIMAVSIAFTVFVLPWIVGEFAPMPRVHGLVFAVFSIAGYLLGAWPSRLVSHWLLERQRVKNLLANMATDLHHLALITKVNRIEVGKSD